MPYYRCPGCGLTVHSVAAFSTARVCPACSEPLPRDSKVYPSSTDSGQFRRVLSARPEAVSKARHTVRALPVAAAARNTLELLVSELVSNSIIHAGLTERDPVQVQITTRSDRVRLAVRDPGPGFAAPSIDAGDPLMPGGRGYVLIDAMADAWGIDDDASGCTAWCEVVVDEQPREAIDRAVTDAYLGDLGRQMAAS